MITEWKLRPQFNDVMGNILTHKTDVDHYKLPHILIIPIEDETGEDDLAGKLLFEISTPMKLDVKHPVRGVEDIIITTSLQLSREGAIALAKTLLITAKQRAD